MARGKAIASFTLDEVTRKKLREIKQSKVGRVFG
jgi:hypothetical protein